MEPTTSGWFPAIVETSEREFISLLIELYRDCPELWKVKSRDYFNRNKKSAAFEHIVCALQQLRPDFTVPELKKKINVLRTNFNREYKLIEKKRATAKTLEEMPVPSLWYYNDLSFIKDQVEGQSSAEASEHPVSDEDWQNELSPSATLGVQDSVLAKKRKCQADATDQLAAVAMEYFKRPRDEEDVVASGWAMKLKKLPPDQKRFAEKIINDVLFQAEMGSLTQEGIRFLSSLSWSTPPFTSLPTKQEAFDYPTSENHQQQDNKR